MLIEIAEGSVHGVNFLDVMLKEPGSYYIMDKGYIDFHQLYSQFHQTYAFFVMKAKDNLKY